MSLRLKTILGIALIEIVLLAILITSSLYFLRTSNEQELIKRAEVTAQLLATMTSDAVISSDLATLDALIQQTLKNNGLIFVRIRNTDGLVLAEGGEAKALGEPFTPISDVTEISGQRIDFVAPIKVGGERFGQVEIGLSSHLLDHLVAAGTRHLLTIATLEIALVAIFGFFLGSVLTRQLAALKKSAKRVAAGDFGYQVEIVGRDEVAETARSFNTMSRALLDHANDLKAARDRAEAGKLHAETVLYDAMNSVSQSIFVIDENDGIEFINKAARKMYPVDWDRIDDSPVFDTFLREVIAVVASERSSDEVLKDRLERYKNHNEHQSWQSRLKDGSIILHTQRPMSNGGIVLVDTDITELYATLEKNKRLEMELLQAHKLESLGTLASGVAHEINTPAQFIGDNLRFLT
ncbi:MAG: PAS-domain containing protein, partial [Pseudomonadota bacterium]